MYKKIDRSHTSQHDQTDYDKRISFFNLFLHANYLSLLRYCLLISFSISLLLLMMVLSYTHVSLKEYNYHHYSQTYDIDKIVDKKYVKKDDAEGPLYKVKLKDDSIKGKYDLWVNEKPDVNKDKIEISVKTNTNQKPDINKKNFGYSKKQNYKANAIVISRNNIDDDDGINRPY